MDKASPEWAAEEKYLASTVNALDAEIQVLDAEISAQQERIDELKEHYSKRHYDIIDDKEGSGILSRMNDFIEIALQIERKKHKLEHVRARPYFGRIDFLEEKDDAPMKVYVGISSISHNNEYYVIDWRAPVGELFYEYGKGKAEYVAPCGVIKGEVVLKRQYDIQKSQLCDVYDVDLNIFDEYLQKILSQVKSGLHNIAATIQREQNRIIRNLKDDVIIVQGYAGCGKTTIALHRIAYALYRQESLKSDNILIFSPNEAFLSHISGILPELGEENTRTATFPKFVRRILKTQKRIESPDEFFERFTYSTHEEQCEILEKLKYRMREVMEKWLNEYCAGLEIVRGFRIGKHMFPARALTDMFTNAYGKEKLVERIDIIHEYVCQTARVERDLYRDSLRYEIEHRFNKSVKRDEIFAEFLRLQGFSESQGEFVRFEDAILMCIMWGLMKNLSVKMDIKHVVIDEAQDYPLIFLEFLLRIFPHAQFAVFGDIYQKTVPGELESLKSIEKSKVLNHTYSYTELAQTYRSSEEIVEYASGLIGKPRHNAFRLKFGERVREIELCDTPEQINRQVLGLLEEFYPKGGTIGIIAGELEVARAVYEAVHNLMGRKVMLIRNARSSGVAEVQVVPVALCKGLEFDTVIVIKKGKLLEEPNPNLEYIACTRAINRLVVLAPPR